MTPKHDTSYCKNFNFIFLLFLLTIIFFSTSALSGGIPAPKKYIYDRPIEDGVAGFYLGAQVGIGWIGDPNRIDFLNLAGQPIVLTMRTDGFDSEGATGRVSFGINFNNFFGAEIGLQQFSNFRSTTSGGEGIIAVVVHSQPTIWAFDYLFKIMWPLCP